MRKGVPSRKKRPAPQKEELWISPDFNLKGPDGNRAWDSKNIDAETGAKFLGLGDVALGRTPRRRQRKPDGGAK